MTRFVLLGLLVSWCAPALPCTFAGEDIFAFQVHEAPRGGAWWVRGQRRAGDSFVLVTDDDDDDAVVVVPTVVSTGGLTTWAIAVPDFPVGTAFRLRGFTPEGEDEPADIALTIIDGARAEEGSLTLDPRATLTRQPGSPASGFAIRSPLEIFDDTSCSTPPPLVFMGTRATHGAVDVVFTIDTPELVVLDVGYGGLDEPVSMIVNAFQADPDVRLRFAFADDRGDEVRLRLRSIATGVAGEQHVVPIPAADVEAPRFEMSMLGCAQSNAPPSPMLLCIALFFIRGLTRRR